MQSAKGTTTETCPRMGGASVHRETFIFCILLLSAALHEHYFLLIINAFHINSFIYFIKIINKNALTMGLPGICIVKVLKTVIKILV